MVNLYEQYAPLKYKLSENEVAVAEYCVIGEVEVLPSKKKKAGDTPELLLSQQNYN